MRNIKISLDFDDVLDQEEVQEYAKDLIQRGIEVWICTARMDNTHGNPNWNTDLFDMMMKLKIPFSNLIMTNGSNKSHFLDKQGFLWHLDDMMGNHNDIICRSDCNSVLYVHWNDWKEKCEMLIKNFILEE